MRLLNWSPFMILVLSGGAIACGNVEEHSMKLYFQREGIKWQPPALKEKCRELPPIPVVAYFLPSELFDDKVRYAMDGLGIPADAIIIPEGKGYTLTTHFGCGRQSDTSMRIKPDKSDESQSASQPHHEDNKARGIKSAL
ncbi:hypothetical protein ACFODZ_08575 [Marinicella sediminis]|uniref:Uncharacterized protein n=1 Tax=Marinicella sediminis TaxID=1792834 RepID=A0ABV7JC90_9GAMM|nr:hypothetical protein [Marinicella sediminis]